MISDTLFEFSPMILDALFLVEYLLKRLTMCRQGKNKNKLFYAGLSIDYTPMMSYIFQLNDVLRVS